MWVTMTTAIGGYRDGFPWPQPGTGIDLPDHEAAALVAAGYAKKGDEGEGATGGPKEEGSEEPDEGPARRPAKKAAGRSKRPAKK